MDHPRLTPKFVAETLGTYLPGLLAESSEENAPLLEPFTRVTSDSRKVQTGCLFVALQGEKFDGHQFIEAACNLGAAGVICRNDLHASVFKTVKVFAVEDTLVAYRKLAAAWRDQFRMPVIGVAGSVGKTTTKELLSALLHGRWPQVLKTEGSQNGFVGIPMTLLYLNGDQGAAVIEIGIDEIGAMVQHMDLVRPNVSVPTAIGPEHLEKLLNLETVAREEAIALRSVHARGGTVIVNLDDPWIAPLANELRGGSGRVLGFSLKGAPVPQGIETLRGQIGTSGETLEVSGLGLEKTEFTLPLPGAHNAQNLLAALAVARSLGLEAQELQAGLSQFKGAYGRSEVRQWKGVPVLCDYYNANPSSVEAGLEVLTQIAAKGRTQPRIRWACLADMLELGTDEEKLHRSLADRLCALGIENVLLYGTRMQWLSDELTRRKSTGAFKGLHSHHASQAALAQDLLARRGSEDAILIKGSRGMRMEEVWKVLEAQA